MTGTALVIRQPPRPTDAERIVRLSAYLRIPLPAIADLVYRKVIR